MTSVPGLGGVNGGVLAGIVAVSGSSRAHVTGGFPSILGGVSLTGITGGARVRPVAASGLQASGAGLMQSGNLGYIGPNNLDETRHFT
ncbi:hypothetical protein PC120_g20380 [Phytophthora cactorum]|nr:hypothetical protein PC120_g20380 [Phytophthora cactorum]